MTVRLLATSLAAAVIGMFGNGCTENTASGSESAPSAVSLVGPTQVTPTTVVTLGADSWDGLTISDDGSTVIATVISSVCAGPPTLVAVEFADEVRLRLSESVTVGTCAGAGRLDDVSASLQRPLGQRQLVDDATGIVATLWKPPFTAAG